VFAHVYGRPTRARAREDAEAAVKDWSYRDAEPVLELERGKGCRVRLYFTEYEGRPLVHLRVWAPGGPFDELRPTKRGVALQADELEQVRDAIGQLIAVRDAETIAA
jgi:hypothetical protein